MDIVVGFDISTHLLGQPLFYGHPLLESYLPSILEDITSIGRVSCGAGTEVQVNVAFKVNKITAKFQLYQRAIFDSLRQVSVDGPTHLNAQFLQSLWETFNDRAKSNGQVLLSHSVSHICILPFVSSSPIACFIFTSSHPLLFSSSRFYSSFQMVLGVKAR